MLLNHLEDIIKIESVQRRFTKRIRGLSNVGYRDRLEILSLESLQLRRLHQDLILSVQQKIDHLCLIWCA